MCMSTLLTLDPPVVPAPVHDTWNGISWIYEGYGWHILIALVTLYYLFHKARSWLLRPRYASLPPEHASDVLAQVRQARLQQQAAWTAVAPQVHRQTKMASEEEKTLQRKYGDHSSEVQPSPEGVVSNSEGFYKGRKDKKKYGGNNFSYSSSSSSSGSSGFKPYIEQSGGGGGGRRFGGSGPKRG